jgi:hypothetical protein
LDYWVGAKLAIFALSVGGRRSLRALAAIRAFASVLNAVGGVSLAVDRARVAADLEA